ncbi:integrase family protein, partial [Ferrovibrio sp.]|uniref:integrase family protein n=1 Tax=Ferrovibrio sp. TaxID=1917215 RepID=UPI00311D812B
MPESIALTKVALDTLPTPISQPQNGKGSYVLHPILGFSGAYVKVTASGLKVFVYQYRDGTGKPRRLTIGRYGALTADGARKAIQQAAARVALGEDPAAAKAEARRAGTVAELMDRYLEDYCRPELDRNTVRSIVRSIVHIKKHWGAKAITGIEPDDINIKLNLIPAGARNGAIAYLRAAWRWGRRHKQVPRNLAEPTEGYRKRPSVSRAQDVTDAEYARIGGCIDGMLQDNKNDPARLLAIKFVALYGCRPCEAMRLTPSNVQRERGYILLKEHKTMRRTGKPKIFIITPECEEVLDQAAALRTLRKSDDYLFPRRWEKYEHNWYASAWRAIRKKAKVQHLSLTNFRSAFITIAHDELDLTLDKIGAVTQHADTRTIQAHYLKTRSS